jgi:hypothetical protein
MHYGFGSKYELFSLRRFEEKRIYAILALYLYELSQNLIDKAIEIHDRQVNVLLSKGRKKQEALQKQNGKYTMYSNWFSNICFDYVFVKHILY